MALVQPCKRSSAGTYSWSVTALLTRNRVDFSANTSILETRLVVVIGKLIIDSSLLNIHRRAC